MGSFPKDVTDAELAVLQVLWRAGPSSIRAITEEVYADDVDAQYSTVKRLLTRLEDKGYVTRDRSDAVHLFAPARSRDDLVGQRLRAVADALCDGSISPLLMNLAGTQALTKEQQQTLRELVEELDKRQP